MFIETLEFTIPVDLCDLFSNLKRGPRSNLEFPASVNSYGTTQDANIQVALRANKLTFKVDGVSSNASMISKSECKTLKLSVFDVDCTMAAEEEEVNSYEQTRTHNVHHHSNQMKRPHDYSVPDYSPQQKSSRNSYSDSRNIPSHQQSSHQSSRLSNQSQSKPQNDTVNVKQEPEDPDLIEIEPDDIEPKKESPYMQIDYSSDVPHTQTTALDRLSQQQSSHSQSPGSSSSSFHQNVPHVQNYSEPGPSQRHGDQSADDFLVFQDDDGEDNEADYSNDDCLPGVTFCVEERDNSMEPLSRFGTDTSINMENHGTICKFGDCGIKFENHKQHVEHIKSLHQTIKPATCPMCRKAFHFEDNLKTHVMSCTGHASGKASVSDKKLIMCQECGKYLASKQLLAEHVNSQHRGVTFACSCGQSYRYRTGLARHRRSTGHELPPQNI